MNTPSTVPRTAELHAPSSWGTVDFISDLHLQADQGATFAVWQRYMENTPADAVFMLGDLFEAWVGDDCVSDDMVRAPETGAFEDRCARVMGQTANRLALFFMHGNRDFLVGERLMNRCNTTLLADPTVLSFNRQRWLLSHGDALCLADVDYMAFRHQVRSAAWQSDFLAKPLAERQAIARGLRQQSQVQHEKRQQSGLAYADVDSAAALTQLQAADAPVLIHGHTHQPAEHDLGHGFSRVVLSDWDASAAVPRAEALRLTASGLCRISLV